MNLRKMLFLIAVLFTAPISFAAGSERGQALPNGQQAREGIENARKACHIDCKKEKHDATAYESCMVKCNKTYPVPPSRNKR